MMSSSIKRKAIAILTVTSVLGLGLFAVAAEPASGGGGADPDLSKLSIDQMKDKARRNVNVMRETLSKSFELLAEAKQNNQLGVYNTRMEIIAVMRGLILLSEQNFSTLQQKAADNDRRGVEHEYVKISIAAAKVQELFAQIRSAGGVVDVEPTDVERTLEIEGGLPPDTELATIFEQPEPIPEPPISVTPYN